VHRPLLEVGALGVLQGLTEFLPVSSSGHLALAELLLRLPEAGLTLNVVLHAGTLLATALVLWRRLREAAWDGAAALVHPERFRQSAGARDVLFVVVASLPTALLGLLLRDAVASWTESPLAIGLGFCITTAVLISTRWAQGGHQSHPSLLVAVLLGVAQGVAVVPGISRSGTTIAVALWLGVRPDRAFELSMLASIPAVLGALLVELPSVGPGQVDPAVALLGAALAFAVGVGALFALRGAIQRGWLSWFALWTAPLAAIALVAVRPC
jgi:undecaprenyl-diphosphatase